MADLRNRQLQERYQTLITTSNISDASPVVGALQNGQGDALTQVTLGLGSVSAPSYSFTGDEDTGMFSSGANVLNLATGGNKRMTIASGGNISIGTANSSAKLQVGTSSEEILRLERDTTSNDSFIDLTYASGHNNDSDANHEYSKIRTKVVANLSGLESSELHFQTINTGTIGNKMVITKEGNVGIGSAPTSLLQLEQSIVPRITLIKTGVLSWYLGNVLQGSDNNFTIGTDSGGNTNILTLDTSGNVGINGTPSDKLEVAGLSNYTGLTLKGDASSRPALTFKNVNQSLLGSIYGTEGRALAFESGGNGTTGVLAMTIDSSGRIGVGVTPESWTTWTPIQIGQASTFGGRISANQTDVANNWYYDGTEKRINAGYAQRYVQDVNGDHYWMTAGTSTADSTISFNTPMIIKNSGNVGIGTTDPDGTLHLDAGTSSDLVIEKDDGGYASLRFHNAGSQASYIQLDASEDMIHYGGSGVNQIIYAGGSERMRIDSSGIVQARRARSNTAGDVALSLQPSDSTIHYGFRIDSANNFLNIDRVDSAGTIMTLDPSGNVGIGVSPSTALHIDQPSNDRAGGLYLEIDGSNYGLSAFVNSGGYGVIGSNGAFTTDILTMNLSNGNVGIGSSDPDHPLTVTAGPSSAGVPVAWIHNSTNSADHDGTVISSTNDGADAEVLHVRANNTTYSNGTSLMLVRGDGNVGFGTTSPDEPVHVAKSTGDAIIAVEANDGNAALYLTSAGSGKDNRIVSGNAKALKFEVQSAGSGQGQGQDPVATGTTVMTLSNDGNLGLGGAPASISADAHWLTLDADDGSSASGGVIYQVNGTTKGAQYVFGSNVYHDAKSGIGHQFAVNGGSTAMTIDTSGNVGIGTTSPNQLLEVANSSGGATVNISTDQTAGSVASKKFNNIDFSGYNNSVLARIQSWDESSSTGHGYLTFHTFKAGGSLTEQMRIDYDGNVGIGNTVASTIGAPNSAGNLVVGSGSGSEGITIYTGNDSNGALCFADGTTSTTTYEGYIQYNHNTNSMQFATGHTERMRVDSSGNILFGGISALPNGTSVYGSAFRTDTNGRMGLRLATSATGAQTLAEFFNGNGSVGSIQTNALATSYVTSSDYRLKENVVSMTSALDRVDQLKPSRFNFIADADKTVDGFLAHEVANVVPEAISGEKDAVDEEGNPIYQGIDQSKLVPLLVGAIQELRAEIEQLKNQ